MKRPLLIPLVFFLIGILGANLAGILMPADYAPAVIRALILMVFFLVVASKKDRVFYPALCLFFLFLGVFRYASSVTPGENDITGSITEAPEKVLIHGTVTSDPEWKGASYAQRLVFPFRTERLLKDGDEDPVTGTVLVNLFNPQERPLIGDKLALGGKISLPRGRTNPAGFDYRAYLDHMGMRAVMTSSEKDYYLKTGTEKGPLISVRRFLSKARDAADSVIRRYLRGDTRAITRSVTLGLRDEIPARTGEAFTRTGTMHILAVSGLHTGIVALTLLGLLRLLRCPRRAAYLVTILGICAFAIFTGCRPSSIRAAIMGSLILFSLFIRWETDITSALALSAFLVTFFQPGQLFRAGFILSYLAVLSIIYVTPLTDSLLGIKTRVFGENRIAAVKRYLLKLLSVSFAIWIGMMPVIASYFHIITPSMILSNLLAVPALFIMVILGFGLLLAGSLWFLAPLARLISAVSSAIVPVFIKAMTLVSHLPLSSVRVPSPNMALIVLFYAVLAGTLALFRRNKRHRVLVTIFLLFAANLFLWNEVSCRPPDSLRVTFFDVGKADASVMEFPDGSVMMIDGGSGGRDTGSDAGRRVLAPYLWQRGVRRVDCVLLTHAHEDHIGGLLYILENFNTGAVIDGGGIPGDYHERPETKTLYGSFREIIEDKKIPYLTAGRKDLIRGFPDTDLIVLNPPKDRSYGDLNNDSVVVKAVTEKGNSALFCADAEAEAMKGMLRFGSLLRSDLMKVPHHGAGLGEMLIVREFMRGVDCADAVITNNARRLNRGLLETLDEQGANVYVTGKCGAVIAEETDGGFKITKYGDR